MSVSLERSDIQSLMIDGAGHIVSEVNARPEIRHPLVKAEHRLGNVQFVFFRVDLVCGAALRFLNQQVVSDGDLATVSMKGKVIANSVWVSLVLRRLFFSSGRCDRFSIFAPISELP